MCLEYNGDLCPLVHFQCIEVTKCKVMTFDRESSSIYRYWAQQPNLFFDMCYDMRVRYRQKGITTGNSKPVTN